jgi:hypothetical protein
MTGPRKIAFGTLIVAALTLGAGGAAFGATTSSPSTTGTATTATTGTTVPSATHAKAPKLPTANEIWKIVRPRKRVGCIEATKQIQRIEGADAAAAKRVRRQQSVASGTGKIKTKLAPRAELIKRAPKRVARFENLEMHGAALIKQIETTCKVTAPAT